MKRNNLLHSSKAIFDPKVEDLDSRRNLNQYLDKMNSTITNKRSINNNTSFKSFDFDTKIESMVDNNYKINNDEEEYSIPVNSKLNLAYYENKKNLELILENKISHNIQEELLLMVLKSGPNLDELDFEKFYKHSLKRKRPTLKTRIFTKMIEGGQLESDEWMSLFEKSMKDKDNPTLREHFLTSLIRSDDNLNDFKLIEFINYLIKNRIDSGEYVSLRYQLLYDISKAKEDLSDCNFEE